MGCACIAGFACIAMHILGREMSRFGWYLKPVLLQVLWATLIIFEPKISKCLVFATSELLVIKADCTLALRTEYCEW